MAALRVGAFLSARLLGFYEAAAAAAGDALARDVEIVQGRSFDELSDGDLDVAFLCGLPYVGLGEGVQALVAPASAAPRYAGAPMYFSDVIARVGEPAERLEELAGRVLAVNEPDSHSGYNMVAATLAERGVPVGGFADVLVTGGHAESLAAVRSGGADVAAVDSHLLSVLRDDDPGIDAEVSVIEALGPSPAQPLAAGPGLDAAEREAIVSALTLLEPQDLAPGLEGVRWLRIGDADYDPIRRCKAAAQRRAGF